MKRFLAVLHARNMEFIRDRSSLGWNIFFPLLLVLAFAAVFSGEPKPLFKVGIMGSATGMNPADADFFATKYVQFIPVDDLGKAIDKVEHFQLDMLVDLRSGKRYWININAPNGYLLGLYLGDGCISRTGRVWRLRIVLDAKYPQIIARCREAIDALMPGQRAATLRRSAHCIEVSLYSKHWPCLLPQHGPGKKHHENRWRRRWC